MSALRPTSRTALGAAAHRAAHQRLEAGFVFKDPYAEAILDAAGRERMAKQMADAGTRGSRLFISARSRIAEDAVAAAVARGVRQVVVLGAGLDTFGLRNPFADQGVTVFEVDHPGSQAWKRARIAAMGMKEPASLVFAPVDFEAETLADGLERAGFRADQAAVCPWLGVVMYLTAGAIRATLEAIARGPDAEVILDYTEPVAGYPEARRAKAAATEARAAAAGEPFISHFVPAEMAAMVRASGFDEVEDLGLEEIMPRYFGAPLPEPLKGPGPHVLRARKIGRPAR